MRSSNALAVALLFVVAVVHYGYEPIASLLYPDQAERAARAVFYVARGFEGAVLYGLLWACAPRRLPVMAACLWGAVESAQTALCRIALGLGGPTPAPGPYGGLCDLATDWPISGLTAVVALVCISIVRECNADKRGRNERD